MSDQGTGNVFEISDSAKGNPKITVTGNRNTIAIGDRAQLNESLIEIRGNDCHILIGESVNLRGQFRARASQSRLTIGAFTTSMNAMIMLHEAGTIMIGKDCMFSGDVRMDVSDMHSICDLETGVRINPASDIEIGDHVWLAQGVTVNKGAHIGTGTVVGAKSLVSGNLPPNCVAVGIPAKVLRSGIKWLRERV